MEIARERVPYIAVGRARLRDRNEEEVKGYLEALKAIHERSGKLPVLEKTILRLHKLTRAGMWDGGRYKDKESDIIEKYPDVRVRVRFRTVPAAKTRAFMKRLVVDWHACLREKWVHPLIAAAAMSLDLLCIHPFRDGNGRVSRLLLLLECHQLGFDVGRYVSLERLIEQNKERYYETLEESSRGWHENKNDPWPLSITSCSCSSRRIASLRSGWGS